MTIDLASEASDKVGNGDRSKMPCSFLVQKFSDLDRTQITVLSLPLIISID
ncbi:hypothetical protein [Chamaesiphon sp. OTE_75_metabat_556]|uniref:hypothetical protein n=1 Tax=Chamaesiphon sp. OTE_75_metabat_556 TaxID=2964692 RepID=UPI00286C573D|nr:hypothetical protein [Chamaesiphon sp. OTE_75_metabat_556]